ncbi:MAG: heavy metal translocating P-type ATPase metal-binding domain-containing protein [Saprospiraceae bacterium]|nr:heavy metal translocating P-type ATPase metal-binding domain-containing protein [Saprospiraceae bacterium]
MAEITAPSTSRKESEPVQCYHCNEPCLDETIHFDDKDFCCQGCKMVYTILSENDMCTYYEIDENAGISLKGKRQQQYAFLDEEGVAEKLLDFKEGNTAKVTFYLPQIHCASCIWLLENLYKLREGILHSKVNFMKKEIYLTFETDKINLRQVVELLDSIGYEPAINLQSLDDADDKPVIQKTLYYQLGIAGFAFGNIMLMSFPEYLGLERGGDSSFQVIFGYLNIALSLPVLLYSGRDYFISAWGTLRHGYLNLDVPIALGMVALFSRSIFEIITQTGSGYLDSFAGLIFFLLIGKWFQQRTYHHVSFERNYKSYFPIAATLRKEGTTKTVSLDQLEINDTVILRHGELIPADGYLIKGKAKIDYSFVTGESEPVEKMAGEKVFAGGRQMGETIEVTLAKKVSQSYLTQLWNDEAFQQAGESSTSKLADLIGRRFTLVVLTVAAVTLAYWYPKDPGLAFNAFTAVLIVACPCAVALSIPFTLGNIIRIFAKNGFYVKNTRVVEELNDLTAVVLDKTGTLTNALQSGIERTGKNLSDRQLNLIRSLALQSNHPLSRQVAAFLEEGTAPFEVDSFKEEVGKGLEGWIDGTHVKLGSADYLSVSNEENNKNVKVWTSINGTIVAGFIFHNQYRSGFQRVMDYFNSLYKTYLLSGDNDASRAELEHLFSSKDNLRFEQSPQDKLGFIRSLQDQGEKVMMLGDGLNDAGALRKADVGLVITENTNNFTPASDGIMDASKFKLLPNFIQLSKKSIQLVHWAYALAFIYNIIGLSYAVTGSLSPVIAAILMPTSSVTIVLFGVGMSSWLGKIGLEK